MAAKKSPLFFVLTPDGESFPIWTQKELDEFISEEANYNKTGLSKHRIFKLESVSELRIAAPKFDYTLEEVK